MKRSFYTLAVLASITCSAFGHTSVEDYVGIIEPQALHQTYENFGAEFEDHQISEEDITLIRSIEEPIMIKVLFGTWCHDSAREVPRLNKLLLKAKNINISSSLIAVDRNKTTDEDYKLEYTPTIIIFQSNKELGRIVEKPSKSLAQDIVDIVRASNNSSD